MSNFSFYHDHGYDRITAYGFSRSGEPGAPELPVVYLNYIIPPDAQVDSLIILQVNIKQISGAYLVYPAQPPQIPGESVPWIEPDSLIYNSDELFPDICIQVMGDGVLDGARIVTVAVYPLQYRPKTRRLYIANNISFDFAFCHDNAVILRPLVRGKYEQATYDAVLQDVVENDYQIPGYYRKPAIVEEKHFISGGRLPAAPGVIITPAEFMSSFQPYATWMTEQGIPTVMVSPQTIYNNTSGVDNAEKVRNYMNYCYQWFGGTYFVLGGDENTVPVRYGTRDTSIHGPNRDIPCDMYFSDLNGNWDVDGDTAWGELLADSADRFPEVFVGRITALNSAEVQNWVTKALHYEKTPGVVFDSILWVRSEAIDTCGIPQIFPSHINHIIAQDYYANAALNIIDHGYGYISIHCHGDPPNITVKGGCDIWNWWPDTTPYDAGLNFLTNLNKYFVVYSMSCANCAYDSVHPFGTDTCIGDAFVDAYSYNQQGNPGPFGACVFLGNTRTGAIPHWRDLEYAFWERVMGPNLQSVPSEPSVTRIGVAEAMSKCAKTIDWYDGWYRHICYAHNLFGSPCFESWTKTSGTMVVTHPTQIPANQPTQFTVTVMSAAVPSVPLQYAKVCLYKSTDVYEVGTTDQNGQVSFLITPRSSGSMKVTVTRLHNLDNYSQYLPSQTTCRVLDYPGGGEQSAGSDMIGPEVLCITKMPFVMHENSIIEYGVPEKKDVVITIYDITGTRKVHITRDDIVPGYYRVDLSPARLASGVYFVILKQGTAVVRRKFLLIR